MRGLKYGFQGIIHAKNLRKSRFSPSDPRGGVTSIYTGTGRAIFWGAFFRAGNQFWGIIFGKIIGGHKFWGIIFSITNYGPIIRYLFQHELNFRVYTLYGI